MSTNRLSTIGCGSGKQAKKDGVSKHHTIFFLWTLFASEFLKARPVDLCKLVILLFICPPGLPEDPDSAFFSYK